MTLTFEVELDYPDGVPPGQATPTNHDIVQLLLRGLRDEPVAMPKLVAVAGQTGAKAWAS